MPIAFKNYELIMFLILIVAIIFMKVKSNNLFYLVFQQFSDRNIVFGHGERHYRFEI